jgi:hypothetical protein
VSDILDGLAEFRLAFQRADIKPPTVMLLESHEEGMRFLSELRQTHHWIALVGSPDLGHVVEMADGSVWMECKVMGISIRWPANKIATPDGSWAFV